jgi:hypothetical protein
MLVKPAAKLSRRREIFGLYVRWLSGALLASQRALLQYARRRSLTGNRGVGTDMKQRKESTDSDPGPRLQRLNEYLEKNFPDFFAEVRFQVGNDDYFLYARFGQYLARGIEHNRTARPLIDRGFTLLNRMARAAVRDPRIRELLISGPLEYLIDAPKAHALARKRLSVEARGYLESLCE